MSVSSRSSTLARYCRSADSQTMPDVSNGSRCLTGLRVGLAAMAVPGPGRSVARMAASRCGVPPGPVAGITTRIKSRGWVARITPASEIAGQPNEDFQIPIG